MIFIPIPASSPLALVFIVPRLSAVSHTEFDLSVRHEPNCGCGADGGVPARHILVSACARDVARPMPLSERALSVLRAVFVFDNSFPPPKAREWAR